MKHFVLSSGKKRVVAPTLDGHRPQGLLIWLVVDADGGESPGGMSGEAAESGGHVGLAR
jgi:hypothetical protein